LFLTRIEKEDIELNKENFDEYTPLRFLRARKLDVDAAMEMLKNHLKWRKENNVDNILEDGPKEKNFKVLDKYWPGFYGGVDLDGVPIWVDRLSQIDPETFLTIMPKESIISYHIYTTEKAMRVKKKISAEKGKNCYTGVVIEDMAGFGRKHMTSACIDIFKSINSINADNYPECLKAFFCINSPTLVQMAYKLVKSFIDPETSKKVHVLKDSFKKELLEYISEDELLTEYGGKNKDCKFKGGGIYSDAKKDGTTYNPTFANVSAGKTTEVEVKVDAKHAPTKIEYIIYSSTGDFKLTINYKGKDGKAKAESLKEEKLNVTGDPVKGELDAEKEGVYAFVFDNSHSWVKGRTIKYHVTVQKKR